MRDGTCPKCRGTEVYAARNGLGLGEGWEVGLRPHLEPGFRGAVMRHRTNDVWNYCCAACGYVETYLIDAAGIGFVRQSWARVPVAAPEPPPAGEG
jgi:hypothetical protein